MISSWSNGGYELVAGNGEPQGRINQHHDIMTMREPARLAQKQEFVVVKNDG